MLDFSYEDVIRRILDKNPWKTEGMLAEKLGIAPNTWTAYKRGKRSFGLHEIANICDLLDVDPFWLLFGDMHDPDMAVLLGGMVRDRQMDEKLAGPDLEVVGGLDSERPAALIDPDVYLSIEQRVEEVCTLNELSATRSEITHLTIAWYNQFLAEQVDLLDSREVEARLYLKGKDLAAQGSVLSKRSAPR